MLSELRLAGPVKKPAVLIVKFENEFCTSAEYAQVYHGEGRSDMTLEKGTQIVRRREEQKQIVEHCAGAHKCGDHMAAVLHENFASRRSA